MTQSYKIPSIQKETYIAAAQQLVALLSSEELAYFKALLSKSQNLPPVPISSSREFQIINNQLKQLDNDTIEKKENGTIMFAHLLAEEIIRKSSELPLVKAPMNPKMPVKRGPVPSLRSGMFDIIPDDLTLRILSLSTASVINWMRSCKFSYSLFSQAEPYKAILNKSLEPASVGELGKFKVMLKKSPNLVLHRGNTGHCGRYNFIDLSSYQIFLKNDEGDNIYPMMLEAFKQLPGGLAEMARQYFEVFPDGRRFRKEWDINEAKKRLDKFIEALGNDTTLDKDHLEQMGEELSAAYKNYCGYIDATLGTGVEGLVCDPEFFTYIVGKYIEHYDPFTLEQCLFYGAMVWDKYMSKLPTGVLRPACQGLHYVVDEKEPLFDNGCVLRDGVRVLPLGSDPKFIFGRDFIEMYYGQPTERDVAGVVGSLRCLQKLCRAKAEEHVKIHTAITAVQFTCRKQ